MGSKTKNKLKTNRGAAKRFKVTASGKVRFRRSHRNHINTKRSSKKVRQCRSQGVLKDCDAKLVSKMLPNG
jgi:large subunit ribosomal protein L35